ncbi:glutathione S-transferase [Pasteurella multocida]|uniref:glutathione S-transferase n=1 Tax=Pasteurella multocida TaxID=747 RepID=UPI002BDE0925|nr:glutathione S-transferase [Pasteurella multocida]MEB3472444.1 glutathione S-transferase [Pasteurella multocida]HDR1853041.1 glutathione S-transferase [Pasteurella multocida]
MKLWHSTTSPFVRKVMVVIKYHHLDNQIELQTVQAAFDPNSPHNQDNPLGRVPALQQDSGDWLYNSQVIAEYLDDLGAKSSHKPRLLSQSDARWKQLQLHALTDGIMENTLPVISERFLRPENEWWTARHQQLTERNIRSFKELARYLVQFGNELNLGTISAVCLIDWYALRGEKLGVNLKDIAPHLVQWAVEMNDKYPELKETQPK